MGRGRTGALTFARGGILFRVEKRVEYVSKVYISLAWSAGNLQGPLNWTVSQRRGYWYDRVLSPSNHEFQSPRRITWARVIG